MEPREFICNIYRGEWTAGVAGGSSGGFPTSAQVDNWIAALSACGFTAVGFNEYIVLASGTWDLWGTRALTQTPGDTILRRLKDAGFKILLRFWAGIHNSTSTQIAEEYGSEVLGPLRPQMGNVYSLNVYSPKSLKLISDFATAVKDAGIHDMADWVSVGWDDSGEADDIRDFAGLPTLTRPVRPPHTLITRTQAAPPRATAPSRTVRIHDAHEAIGIMFRAVLDVFGNSKPIGCMRGSCWHDQPKRRNLPFFPGEALVQTNDVNQLADGDCTGVGFETQPVQREAIAFACDILRGAEARFAVIEVDGQDGNFQWMVPPTPEQAPPLPPHPGPPWTQAQKLAFEAEVIQRASTAFARGISFMCTHFPYSYLLPPQSSPWSWRGTFEDIAVALDPETTPILVPVGLLNYTVTDSQPYDFMPDAIDAWQEEPSGSAEASKPIRFSFDLT